MDSIENMRVFVKVAQLSGFSRAARGLGLSTAAVTKHVAALERRIGTRLLDRTTRSVAMTESGRVYYERCLECLQAFDDADAAVSVLAEAPRGVLRIAAPLEFGEAHLTPLIVDFMRAHPEITIDLRLSNRTVDLIDEGLDVAIDIHHHIDSPYVVRKLAAVTAAVFGSEAYFEAHGRPRSPKELEERGCLVFSAPPLRDELTFTRGSRSIRVKQRPVMISNSVAALLGAVEAGLGLCVLPSFALGSALEAGRIERTLTDWSISPAHVYAAFPARRFVPAKVRAFLDALRSAFGSDPTRDPWWPIQ